MDEFFDAIRLLPAFLWQTLNQFPTAQAAGVQEIRLRSGRPVTLTVQGRAVVVTPAGRATEREEEGLWLEQSQLLDAWHALCGYSVHSIERELTRGFFTLRGGHRVGVAGIAHWSGEVQTGWRTVTSLNIRVARARSRPLPADVEELTARSANWLVAGPPGSGKTTLLRDVARALSRRGARVTVVDERCELFPCSGKGFALPVPLHCDVLSDMPKAEGILTAVRSLGPQYILCDELGGGADLAAVEQGLACGVRFIVSVHGECVEDLTRRCGSLWGMGGFVRAVFLRGQETPGQVRQVVCCP